MRSKTQSMLFALAVSAAATLSIAAVGSPAAARGPLVPVPEGTTAANSASAPKKICMEMEALTGSRIPNKICKTRAQWEADGFTVTTRAEAKAESRR